MRQTKKFFFIKLLTLCNLKTEKNRARFTHIFFLVCIFRRKYISAKTKPDFYFAPVKFTVLVVFFVVFC